MTDQPPTGPTPAEHRMEEARAAKEDRDNVFRKELGDLINCHSRENGSDTPDFILADYMASCLDAYDAALAAREAWYGRAVPGFRG